MTYEFQYLMQLLGAASASNRIQPPEEELSWERVFELADEQMILPLIAAALKNNPDLGCPSELLRLKTANVFSAVLTDCARRGSVIALLDEMEHAGIHSFVVKGFAAAANYCSPENRISCDTDICVDAADEDAVCDFLRERGFFIKPRWENGHHAVAHHPVMGIIEVHVRLYDEIVEDVWFNGIDPSSLVQEPRQRVDTADGTYYTLGPTDHLIFMALHMIKHFILCGMSLRMMLDVSLHIVKHKDVLDMDRLRKVLNVLNYDCLMNAVLWAMIRYCGFNAEDFSGIGSFDGQCVEMILSDLEKGGWMGKNNEAARKESWYEYNRQIIIKKKSKWQYRLYMIQWQHSFKLSTVFPGKKRLSLHYPYVLKYPWLIPFAWIHRLIFRGFALLKNKALTSRIIFDEEAINSESKERIAMFRQLKMM